MRWPHLPLHRLRAGGEEDPEHGPAAATAGAPERGHRVLQAGAEAVFGPVQVQLPHFPVRAAERAPRRSQAVHCADPDQGRWEGRALDLADPADLLQVAEHGPQVLQVREPHTGRGQHHGAVRVVEAVHDAVPWRGLRGGQGHPAMQPAARPPDARVRRGRRHEAEPGLRQRRLRLRHEDPGLLQGGDLLLQAAAGRQLPARELHEQLPGLGDHPDVRHQAVRLLVQRPGHFQQLAAVRAGRRASAGPEQRQAAPVHAGQHLLPPRAPHALEALQQRAAEPAVAAQRDRAHDQPVQPRDGRGLRGRARAEAVAARRRAPLGRGPQHAAERGALEAARELPAELRARAAVRPGHRQRAVPAEREELREGRRVLRRVPAADLGRAAVPRAERLQGDRAEREREAHPGAGRRPAEARPQGLRGGLRGDDVRGVGRGGLLLRPDGGLEEVRSVFGVEACN